MLEASGRAAFIVALHMPHLPHIVKRNLTRARSFLDFTATLRGLSSDLTDTLRDTTEEILAS
jgi:hypothetical protein